MLRWLGCADVCRVAKVLPHLIGVVRTLGQPERNKGDEHGKRAPLRGIAPLAGALDLELAHSS